MIWENNTVGEKCVRLGLARGAQNKAASRFCCGIMLLVETGPFWAEAGSDYATERSTRCRNSLCSLQWIFQGQEFNGTRRVARGGNRRSTGTYLYLFKR